MSWTVRYVVDLDRLQAAVSAGRSTAVLPTVRFDRGALSAVGRGAELAHHRGPGLLRSDADDSLHQQLLPPVSGAAAQVGLGPAGLQIGIPMATRHRGDCAADDYTLGPSLWDGGAATVAVSALSLTGGRLPAQSLRSGARRMAAQRRRRPAGLPDQPLPGDRRRVHRHDALDGIGPPAGAGRLNCSLSPSLRRTACPQPRLRARGDRPRAPRAGRGPARAPAR